MLLYGVFCEMNDFTNNWWFSNSNSGFLQMKSAVFLSGLVISAEYSNELNSFLWAIFWLKYGSSREGDKYSRASLVDASLVDASLRPRVFLEVTSLTTISFLYYFPARVSL